MSLHLHGMEQDGESAHVDAFQKELEKSSSFFFIA
jgi:hypothetical protein